MTNKFTGATALALIFAAGTVHADQMILDDLIATFSLCVGNDCVNGENFGADTIRLKENNLRIHFNDTSASASFPNVDWRLVANDSENGGANYFAIQDATNNKTGFRVEANAPTNALFVDDDGDIGVGTGTPALEVHVQDGDSPSLRLQQDGSNGWTPQTWDVAGNEANFFVRDVTNGSEIPFKIKPGADDNALFIAANNRIGLLTDNPQAELHIRRTSGDAKILVQNTAAGNQQMLELENNGTVWMTLDNGALEWNIQNKNESLRFTNAVGAGIEMMLSQTGDLTIAGGLVTGTAGSCDAGSPCDGVFDPDVYNVPPMKDYAKQMWDQGYLPAVGPTLPGQPVEMTKKMLSMLNALEHAHIYIDQLNTQLGAQQAEMEEMRNRLDALEHDEG